MLLERLSEGSEDKEQLWKRNHVWRTFHLASAA